MFSVRKPILLLFVMCLFLVGSIAAQAQTLTVYSPLHEYEISRILNKFTSDTGIQTEFIRLSAGAMASRIVAEKARPGGDIFFGGPSETHEAIIPEDVLLPYTSPNLAFIDSSYYHPQYYWSGFYVGPIGVAINSSRWKQEFPDKEYPRTWDDLLDPDFRNEISMASPAASGTAYNVVATQFFRLGEEGAWSYLEELDKNIAYYTSSGAAPAQQVGTGEALLGICFAHDIMKPMQAGYPIDLVIPQQTGWEIGAVSIIKNGPNLEAAKKFVDWILLADAQQLHTDLSLRISTHPDVQLPPGAVALSELDLVDYDYEWAGENRQRIVDEWNMLFF